jgi:hypothetical protein
MISSEGGCNYILDLKPLFKHVNNLIFWIICPKETFYVVIKRKNALDGFCRSPWYNVSWAYDWSLLSLRAMVYA